MKLILRYNRSSRFYLTKENPYAVIHKIDYIKNRLSKYAH